MTGGLLANERPAAPLERCLHGAVRVAGGPDRLAARLKEHVHRVLVDVDGVQHSLVVEWSDPATAHRTRLVARRWLPAAGLEDLGALLLAVAAEPNGDGAWLVYDDLPGRPLATDAPVEHEVLTAIDAIARLHTAFAGHRLLPECRLWGGDRGIHFYSANVDDAISALHVLDLAHLGAASVPARDALLHRMEGLRAQEPVRGTGLPVGGRARHPAARRPVADQHAGGFPERRRARVPDRLGRGGRRAGGI